MDTIEKNAFDCLLELNKTEVLAKVSVEASVTVPRPTSNSASDLCMTA